MDQQTQTPATPAPNTPSGLTAADVAKMIGEATAPLVKQLEAALADQKVLADTFAKLPPAAMDEGKIVEAALAKLEAKTAEAGKATAKKAAIDKYTAEKMADVLKSFPELVKLGEDPAKWAEEEQAIRTVVKGRLEGLGVKTADVGGSAGGTAPAAAAAPAAYANMSENMAKVTAAIQAGK